jgi:hypothetical protein
MTEDRSQKTDGCRVLGFRFQVSAPPPAKKTAGQIEKETLKFHTRIQIAEAGGFKKENV